MDGTAKQLLALMFRAGEGICVSPNKYSFHSLPLETVLAGTVTLLPKEETAIKLGFNNALEAIETVDSSTITLCALNPIKGFREDLNCTAFRNFLVEIDTGSSEEQLAYIEKLNMPYSAAVFSGNKSLHFLISLDKDLPSEKVYRFFAEWILNVATLADQNTKNPSRSIRVPGAYREPDKKQVLVRYNGVIPLDSLVNWLSKHQDAKPKQKQSTPMSRKPIFEHMKPWVSVKLKQGIRPPNRNKQWFQIAIEFASAGYSEYATIESLRGYFEPERDFKEKEWETAIKSAFKWTYERKSRE